MTRGTSSSTEWVTVYRREAAALHLSETLATDDTLASALLPGFSYRVGELFSELS
jgi:hypothetical protein